MVKLKERWPHTDHPLTPKILSQNGILYLFNCEALFALDVHIGWAKPKITFCSLIIWNVVAVAAL